MALSILIERISPAPLAVTLILSPAAVTWTVFSSNSACALATCACICCACFINLLRFTQESGPDLAFEHLERLADQRIVRVVLRARGAYLAFWRQVFVHS